MKKKIIFGIIIAILLALLVPIPIKLRDGGTIEYTAILYKISKVHSLKSIEEQEKTGEMYNEGTIIKILGFEIYNNVFNGQIESSETNLQSFELKYVQRKDLGIKEIYDTGEYKIKTFGGDVTIKLNGIEYSFEDALNQNKITGEDIINQAEKDEKNNLCQKNLYYDGGSAEYKYEEYTILKINHNKLKSLDSDEYFGEDNHDLIIGMKGDILNRYESQNTLK